MQKIDEKTFAMICFLCLMDHHGEGWKNAHISYIEEKRAMLDAGYSAFGYLDSQNKGEVILYFSKWELEFPIMEIK